MFMETCNNGLEQELKSLRHEIQKTYELSKECRKRKAWNEENIVFDQLMELHKREYSFMQWIKDLNNSNIPYPVREQMKYFVKQYVLTNDSSYLSTYLALKSLYI